MSRQDQNLPIEVLQRLCRIEEALSVLTRENTVKDFYTIAEVAKIIDRAEFTVREWARLGRIRGSKRLCGRGNAREWMISHEELKRIRNQGLLPRPTKSNTADRVA
jgi:transposase